MKWQQNGVWPWPGVRRWPGRRQQVWLLQGLGLGALLIGMLNLPLWSAWWAWWQRAPLPTPGPAAQTSSAAQHAQQALAQAWAQREAGLDDVLAGPQHWRDLRVRHVQHGLTLLQWQALDAQGPAQPADWPLVVQRARLQLQGAAGAWTELWASTDLPGGLWRLDRLDGQAHAGGEGQWLWRWQAEWSLALQPAGDPGQAEQWRKGTMDARAAAETEGEGKGEDQGLAAGSAGLHLASAVPGQAGGPATSHTGKPDAMAPLALEVDPQASKPSQVGGEGLRITDWPLSQLQWVGLWTVAGQQEALFSAQGRLFRVRPGDAIGQEGLRWVGGDARQLALAQGPQAATTSTAATAPGSGTFTLRWESRP